MANIPRKLSLVKFTSLGLSHDLRRKYPFRVGATYLFIGEIPNMPDHCVVVDFKASKIYSGFHTDHFIELKNDDL